ncbi:hypothetical protein [Spiroplasma clarkii]|uniref:Uncharacterized protein n=1 Tax=Spiroplasma clarkii TaxID=2139 RepID=A0A2K8KLM0_9MOLU|nr:hypothetical protein [Spiroplasma clarkii]ATX70374.1 hypothetical protein SCLAR_v1c00370 [Spiroplasma clarkii]
MVKRESNSNKKEELLIKLDLIQEALLSKTESLLNTVSEEINYNKLHTLQSYYFNAIHSVDIAYGISEKQENTLTNSDIKKIKKFERISAI